MESMARPCFAALHVSDLEAASRFYKDGLGINLKRDEMEPHLEVSWHQPYFHFALFPKDEDRQPALDFMVDDVEATHERLLAAGATVVYPPSDRPWGKSAWYVDPDGDLVGITEQATHHTLGQ